jgi:hypothetical protein
MSTAIEHLRVAHHLALATPHRSDLDPAELVRGWMHVAQAAQVAHQRMVAESATVDRALERVALDAEALASVAPHLPWPGPGRADVSLAQVAAALEAVGRVDTASQARPGEEAEADRLLTSVVWTTAQMVARAVRDHAFDVRHGRVSAFAPSDAALSVMTGIHRRLNASEQLAAGALHESRIPIEPSDSTAVRLRRSVASWDVEAHRALLGNRSTAVLHVLAHLEAETVKAVQVFITQAVHAGFIDHLTGARLLPVLRDSSSSWERLRDVAAELSFASTTIPISFIDSARDLQEAFLDAVHTTPDGDHAGVLRAASSHLDTSVAIAGATCDLIATGELRAPARAIARLLAEQAPDDPHHLPAPVSAVAIHRGLSLPLDAEGRKLLESSAQRSFANAHETVKRASGLDALYRDIPAGAERPTLLSTKPGTEPVALARLRAISTPPGR